MRDGTSMARCRLGVNVSVGETFLPGMLKLLEEKIPGIHMEVLVGNTVTIEEKLNENEIDFAVVDGLKDQTRRVIQPLFRGEMAAVCAPSYGPWAGDCEGAGGVPAAPAGKGKREPGLH